MRDAQDSPPVRLPIASFRDARRPCGRARGGIYQLAISPMNLISSFSTSSALTCAGL